MVVDGHSWYFVRSPRLLLLNSLLYFVGLPVSAKKIMGILSWNVCVCVCLQEVAFIGDFFFLLFQVF